MARFFLLFLFEQIEKIKLRFSDEIVTKQQKRTKNCANEIGIRNMGVTSLWRHEHDEKEEDGEATKECAVQLFFELGISKVIIS